MAHLEKAQFKRKVVGRGISRDDSMREREMGRRKTRESFSMKMLIAAADISWGFFKMM